MAKTVRKILVYDFETDDKYPETTNPVQIAAIVIDPYKLEIISNAEFKSFIRPDNIDDENYYESHLDCIKWHAGNYKITPEEVYNKWKNAPSEKLVWKQFESFVNKHNLQPSRPTAFNAPIACGYNIINFDNVITERLSKKYKTKTLFNKLHKYDVLDLIYPWLINNNEIDSISLDSLRDFFGITKAGGHDALKDVYDTAQIFIRLQKLINSLAPRVKFKGSFNNV